MIYFIEHFLQSLHIVNSTEVFSAVPYLFIVFGSVQKVSADKFIPIISLAMLLCWPPNLSGTLECDIEPWHVNVFHMCCIFFFLSILNYVNLSELCVLIKNIYSYVYNVDVFNLFKVFYVLSYMKFTVYIIVDERKRLLVSTDIFCF